MPVPTSTRSRRCDGCGAEIPPARLVALPDTRRCHDCSDVERVQGFMSWDGKTAQVAAMFKVRSGWSLESALRSGIAEIEDEAVAPAGER